MAKDDLAQSDRERECIKYAVYKSSGLTPTVARRLYGYEDTTKRTNEVDKAIEERKQIQENIEMLTKAKDKAILLSHGIVPSSSDCSDGDMTSGRSSDECSSEFIASEVSQDLAAAVIDYTTVPLQEIVEGSNSNMFQVAEQIESHLQRSFKRSQLDALFKQILSLPESCYGSYLIHQSYRALLSIDEQSLADRQSADVVNGLVITDSVVTGTSVRKSCMNELDIFSSSINIVSYMDQ